MMRFNIKITTLAPMSHNSDESVGIDTKFRRMEMFCGDHGLIPVPVYSGNAFRGILRRIAARQFCELLGYNGVDKSLKDALYYTFFCGGSLQKGSAQDYIEIGKRQDLRRMIPFLSIFGSAVQNQIIGGRLQIGVMVPVSKETVWNTGIESTDSVWEMTEEVFYTRRDDLEDKVDGQVQQMKYTVECIKAGVCLAQVITVKSSNPVELGCFGHAMDEMIKTGVIGGKSGVGHGRVIFEPSPSLPDASPYLDYIEKNKKEIAEYVQKLSGAL